VVLGDSAEAKSEKNILDFAMPLRELEGLWQFREHAWNGESNFFRARGKVESEEHPRFRLKVCAAGLFEGVGELKDAGFAEGRAKDLEADRQIFLGRFAARDGDAGDSGERSCNSVDIR